MNLIDVGIVGLILLGVLLGWSRGLIGPLLAEAGFLITFWIVARHPAILDAILPPSIPRPMALVALPGVIGLATGVVGRTLLGATFRLPLARQADKVVGAAVHGALAGVIVYVVLVAMAGADRVLTPITTALSIGSTQMAATQTLLSQYPEASGFLDPGQLSRLSSVAAVHPVPFAALGQYAEALAWYEQQLRPQLKGSRLAPLVLQYGAHLPIVGRPVTLS
ncbi:MAG TPA: CvpA family protein [Candidatus Limnocylindrales bacterium]|nr:CvpA family protein [Candidatus Limnocylindrales bacterium]